MSSFVITIIISSLVAVVFIVLQSKFFNKTRTYINVYYNFFPKKELYQTQNTYFGEELFPQIEPLGNNDTDICILINEINNYVVKTRGTTDFSVIQNKVERKLNMRYDQSTGSLSFPTYLGLMGTFFGVFLGIIMFLFGFDSVSGITDNAISNLLIGVVVSMLTSFLGLVLTTINNYQVSIARKKVEEDKNDFYDFVQTELMPSLDVSLVSAISKLHTTVNSFEPAFNSVINSFKETFDNCTKAFGRDFETHVKTVANAVNVMGQNMDMINQNIEIQKTLIETVKSDEIINGLERYIEAANQFVGITKSLNKFEDARRMMLAAAQEAITIQNQYSDSLKIPQEIALRVNQILDRIKNFEENINNLGTTLNSRDILGNDVVNAIQDQVKSISRKNQIADRYLETADENLEILYKEQTAAISQLTIAYKNAISTHLDSFEQMLSEQTKELEKRHSNFLHALEERFSVEDVRKEFTNLKRLESIENALLALSNSSVKGSLLEEEFQKILAGVANFREELNKSLNAMSKSADVQTIADNLNIVTSELSEIRKNTKEKSRGGWFGRS